MKFAVTIMQDSDNSDIEDVQCIFSTMTEENRIKLTLSDPHRTLVLCIDELKVVINAAKKGI